MRRLEAEGYTCTRAGGSLGLWDVIAIRWDSVRLIQSKTNRPAPKSEREAMIAFKVPDNVSKEQWVWHDYVRQPEIRGMHAADTPEEHKAIMAKHSVVR